MALTKERIGEIAMILLQHKLEKDGGLRLDPKGLKREIKNSSKEIGIEPHEMAQFVKILLEASCNKVVAGLDAIIADPKNSQKH